MARESGNGPAALAVSRRFVHPAAGERDSSPTHVTDSGAASGCRGTANHDVTTNATERETRVRRYGFWEHQLEFQQPKSQKSKLTSLQSASVERSLSSKYRIKAVDTITLVGTCAAWLFAPPIQHPPFVMMIFVGYSTPLLPDA